jgi:hypothetical protein
VGDCKPPPLAREHVRRIAVAHADGLGFVRARDTLLPVADLVDQRVAAQVGLDLSSFCQKLSPNFAQKSSKL